MMQRGGDEVEIGNSASEAPPRTNGFGVGEIGGGGGGGGGGGNSSLLPPFPGMQPAAPSSAVNFMQSVRIGDRETMAVEQTLQLNRGFTVPPLQTQPGNFLLETSFNHGGSELNSLFPDVNNSVVTGPMNSLHAFQRSPYENVCFPTDVLSNMRMVDNFGNPYNLESFQMQRESIPLPGNFCNDSVFQPSSLPVAALQQPPLLLTTERQPFMNFNTTGPPIHEMIKNQEMNIFSASHGLRIGSSSDTSVSARKRKLVCQSQPSGMGFSIVPDGSRNINLEAFPERGLNLQNYNRLGLTSSLNQSSIPSSRPHHGLQNLEDLLRPVNDELLEERGWVMVLQKELKNSDVGSLGRIVLPKKEAEENLPTLSERYGIFLRMQDMVSSVTWEFKFRYWPNNRSRMYVMENTGSFVRTHNLQTGDHFIIYKDKFTGKYLVRGRKMNMGSSAPANWVQQSDQADLGEGSSQQPRRDKGMEATHLPSQEESR